MSIRANCFAWNLKSWIFVFFMDSPSKSRNILVLYFRCNWSHVTHWLKFKILLRIPLDQLFLQLNDREIRTGNKIGVTVSFNNHRLFVGNIPKNRDRGDVYKEFNKQSRKCRCCGCCRCIPWRCLPSHLHFPLWKYSYMYFIVSCTRIHWQISISQS